MYMGDEYLKFGRKITNRS